MGRRLDLSSAFRIAGSSLAGLITLLMLAGCGTEATPAPTATQPAPTVTSAPVAEDTPTQANVPTATNLVPTPTASGIVVPEGQFMNPVIKSDFPDPGIINV